jgi:hypothetical protein
MPDTEEPAFLRIVAILNELQTQVNEGFNRIHAIAQEEQQRYEEDSDPAAQWFAFGGEQMMSDAFTAERAMTWQLSALFGQLAQRQLNKPDEGENNR